MSGRFCDYCGRLIGGKTKHSADCYERQVAQLRERLRKAQTAIEKAIAFAEPYAGLRCALCDWGPAPHSEDCPFPDMERVLADAEEGE